MPVKSLLLDAARLRAQRAGEPADVRNLQDRRCRPVRNPGMARIHRFRAENARRRTRPVPARADHRFHAPFWCIPAVQAQYRLRQHDLAGPGARIPGRPRPGTPYRGLPALERNGDGRAGQPAELRIRRPYRELRLGGDAVRSGFQSFLACSQRPASGRHGLHPGPLVARDLRARVPRRPVDRRPPASSSARKSAAAACRRIRTRG